MYVQTHKYVYASVCISSLPLDTQDAMWLCSQWLTFYHGRSTENLSWTSLILIPEGMACTLNQIFKLIQPLASIWLSLWWCVWPFYGGWAAGHSVGPPQHTHTSTALIPDPSQDKSTFPFYPSINSFISYASNICHVMILDTLVPQNEDGLVSTLQEVRVRTGGIIRLIHR